MVLGGCSTFVAAEDEDPQADTEGTSAAETEQTPVPTGADSETSPTSGASGTSGAPESTTDADTTVDPTGRGTTSEGSSGPAESTGNASSGPDPTDDSSTGDPSTTCGDSRTQDGEDCDDGNDDELDGCTSNCVEGPTGIGYGAIVTSGLGGGSDNTGIDNNSDECPAGEVLVGLQGDLTSEPWLGVIGGVCRPAALTNTDPPEFATGGPATELPEHGGFNGGGAWSTECSGDEVIVGVRGGSGTVIDGLQIQCASIDTIGDPGAYELDPSPNVEFETLQGGGGGGTFGPLTCPAGTVAMGLRTRTNSFVIQVELRCSELHLTY